MVNILSFNYPGKNRDAILQGESTLDFSIRALAGRLVHYADCVTAIHFC